MGETAIRKVDQNGLKVGQAATISLLIVAFIFNDWILVALVALAQLLGAVDAPYAPYRLIYRHVFRRFDLLPVNVVPDNPEPHRFAMLLGGILNTLAVALLLAGASVAAWVLSGIVVVLANINFWLNFCMGCWMYYQLHRLGVPGFTAAPLER